MPTDLTRDQMPTEFFTVRVHNFKDDPYAEMASLHGLFTSRDDAATVEQGLREAYPDFLTVEVVPIQFGTVEQVAQAQDIGWVPEGASQESTPPAGTYTNPTPESINAEVEGDAALREQMRAEQDMEEAYLRNQGFVPDETGTADAEADGNAWTDDGGYGTDADQRPDTRCHYIAPGQERYGICGVDDHAHHVLTSHPFAPGPQYPTQQEQ